MGLLLLNKKITNIDEYPMYFSNIPEKTLFKKASTYVKTPAAFPLYIDINVRQGVLILQNGKLFDFCFAPGVYYIEDASSPAYAFGRCDKQTVNIELFENADFSFLGLDRQYVYVNFQPVKETTVTLDKPIEYLYKGKKYSVNFKCSYSVKISDPFTLFQKIVVNDDGEYCITDTFVNKLSQELKSNITNEILLFSKQNISPEKLKECGNQILSKAAQNVTFAKALGLDFASLKIGEIEYVSAEPVQKKEIAKPQSVIQTPQAKAQTTPTVHTSTTNGQPVQQKQPDLQNMQNQLNKQMSSGAEELVFNVDLLNVENTEQQVPQQKQQMPENNELNLDFTAFEIDNVQETANTQQNPPSLAQKMKRRPQQTPRRTDAVTPQTQVPQAQQNTQQSAEGQQMQQLFPLANAKPSPPNTFDRTVHTMQKQPAPHQPKTIDVGIEGLDLSMSDMSVEKPQNKSKNSTIFSPFGEDNEWLCPQCLNEAIGDFCGFCGQKRVAQFKVAINPTENTEWTCPSCNTQNFLKFCSNCGRSKPTGNIAPQTQQPKFCPSCGCDFSSLNGLPKFCPECGLKFQ